MLDFVKTNWQWMVGIAGALGGLLSAVWAYRFRKLEVREARLRIAKLEQELEAQRSEIVLASSEEIVIYSKSRPVDLSDSASYQFGPPDWTPDPQLTYKDEIYMIAGTNRRVVLHTPDISEEPRSTADKFYDMRPKYTDNGPFLSYALPGLIEIKRLDSDTLRIILGDPDNPAVVSALIAKRCS